MSKKDKIANKVKSGDNEVTIDKQVTEKKVSRINEGKCCRCVYRDKQKVCANKKSNKSGKYVARKGHCNCFKYND